MPSMQYREAEDEDERDYSLEGLHLQHIADDESENAPADAVVEGSDEDDEDIEVVRKADGGPAFDLDDFPDDKIFTTKQVAEFCKLKGPQDVRNLLAVWDTVIKVDRDPNNRTLWSKSHVQKLREMLYIKKERGFTGNEVLDFYTTAADIGIEEPSLPSAAPDKQAIELYAKVLSNAFGEKLMEKTEDLRQNDAKILEEIEKSKQQNEASMQAVMELVKNLQEGQNALKEEQKVRDEEIQKLREENEALKASLEESKKKKSFFGSFFK